MKKIILLFLVTALALGTLLQGSSAQTARISSVDIHFSGTVAGLEGMHSLIATSVKALVPYAASAGTTTLRLQSVAYSLAPDDKGYAADGSLSVDVIPEGKTAEFVALLQKQGFNATISYFNTCR